MNLEAFLNDEIPWEGPKLAMLEQLVDALNGRDHKMMFEAQNYLEELSTKTNFWLHIDQIITNSKNSNVIFFALNELQSAIKTKWNTLDVDSKTNFRNFVAKLITQWAENSNDKNVRRILLKANSILVEIVKREWNTTWTTAVSDIIRSSTNSQSICENNLQILKELSSEVFQFAKNSLPSSERKALVEKMGGEMKSIYDICAFVGQAYISSKDQVGLSLIRSMIETLTAYIEWMPSEYLFLTDLLDTIVAPLLFEKRLCVLALKCFGEVFSEDHLKFSTVSQNNIDATKRKAFFCFSKVVEAANQVIPGHNSFEDERLHLISSRSPDLNFFEIYSSSLSYVLTSFIKGSASWIEGSIVSLDTERALREGLKLIVKLTEVRNPIIFKTTIEFWKFLVAGLISMPSSPLNLNSFKTICDASVKDAILVIVTRVPKPQEMLIYIDEEGNPRKETLVNSETAEIYEMVRDILRNYAKSNSTALENIISMKYESVNSQQKLNFDSLNSICWAVGTLAGSYDFEQEKKFLIIMLRQLLKMCLLRPTTEEKSVVAANIMHIVSQNQVFLQTNFELLQIVVKKLFEFMNEKFPGVAEMACNTFLKISENLKNEFVISQKVKENTQTNEPFIIYIITEMPNILRNLEPLQKLQIFESIGHLISAEQTADMTLCYLEGCTKEIIGIWRTACEGQIEILRDENFAYELAFFLRACERLCATVGIGFQLFFNKYFQDLTKIYSVYSDLLGEALRAIPGESTASRKFRSVRKEIMSLLKTFVSHWDNHAMKFIEQYSDIFSFVVNQYTREDNHLKENEALGFLGESINHLKRDLVPVISVLLPPLIINVLPLISMDFVANVDTRVQFFKLLQAIANNCFEVFLLLPADTFKTVIDCVLWAIKHQLQNHYDIGLETLSCILNNVVSSPEYYNQFFKFYFEPVINELIFVLTDDFHKNGFHKISNCLYYFIGVLSIITTPIFPTGNESVNTPEEVAKFNQLQAYEMIYKKMTAGFPNLKDSDHAALIQKLFGSATVSEKDFRQHLRDYLIMLNVQTNSE